MRIPNTMLSQPRGKEYWLLALKEAESRYRAAAALYWQTQHSTPPASLDRLVAASRAESAALVTYSQALRTFNQMQKPRANAQSEGSAARRNS